MLVKEVMTASVETVATNESVRLAAKKMKDHGLGAVPVFDDSVPVGILTGGDIATRVVAEGLDPDKTRSVEILTAGVLSCSQDTPVDEALKLMGENRIHRLLVLDGQNRPVGIVSVGDLVSRLNAV